MQIVSNPRHVRRLVTRVLPSALVLAATVHAQDSNGADGASTTAPCKGTATDGKPCRRTPDITELDAVQVHGVRASVADAIAIKQSSSLIIHSIVAKASASCRPTAWPQHCSA